jgi:hypothetical protein
VSDDHEQTAETRLDAYVREALRLNGLDLSEASVASTKVEFQRVQDIVEPLLRFDLPDRLDLAPVYRP